MNNQFDGGQDDDGMEDESPKKSGEFAKLLEDSFRKARKSISPGDKIQSEILSIGKEDIFVSTGTMHDGIVKRKDLLDAEGKLNHKVGDIVTLYVIHSKGSEIFLSPKASAKSLADDLEDAYDQMLPVEGRVSELCKGGFRVLMMGKSAFCPISQMDLKRIEDQDEYLGKKFDFLITQFSEGGRNIVVSRRKVLEERKGLTDVEFAENNKPGEVIQGTVIRVEKYGAFIELHDQANSGVEGLAHVSELSWSRIADPYEVVQVGQKVTVKILRVEEKEGRLMVSLSLKQAGAEPWQDLPFKEGQTIAGKVTRCMKFGAFVELIPGVEGLIPLSEMSDTKRVNRSNEIVKEGDKIQVLVKAIQPSEHRILLSLKSQQDTGAEDWKAFKSSSTGSFGTLADQFRAAADKKKSAK